METKTLSDQIESSGHAPPNSREAAMESESRQGQNPTNGQQVAEASGPCQPDWDEVRWREREPDTEGLPFSVRVGLNRDFCEMRAQTIVARFAINELGRLTQHREWQTLETLSMANVAIQNAIEDDIAPRALTEHLAKMRQAYMHSLSVVSHSATKQLTIAVGRGWGSPFWLLSSFLRELLKLGGSRKVSQAQAMKRTGSATAAATAKNGDHGTTDQTDEIEWISARS